MPIFLAACLSRKTDLDNFPTDQYPALCDSYEGVFQHALNTLDLPKEAQRGADQNSASTPAIRAALCEGLTLRRTALFSFTIAQC
jgi:hypothetical protein